MLSEEFNIFSDVHTSKETIAKNNRATLLRRARNYSKEQLLKALRKKKECNAKAQRVVETMIEKEHTEQEFLAVLKEINQCHMEDIIQERAIVKICGYPLCDNELRNIPKKKYAISLTTNKVYDITERKNFCSGECYKASNYVKQQMLTSPLWLRDQEDIPNFRLLNGTHLVYRDMDTKKSLKVNDVPFGELKIVERTYDRKEQADILEDDETTAESARDETVHNTVEVNEDSDSLEDGVNREYSKAHTHYPSNKK